MNRPNNYSDCLKCIEHTSGKCDAWECHGQYNVSEVPRQYFELSHKGKELIKQMIRTQHKLEQEE